ncbi:MAG: HD domain-containing protein [Nanoarchaeota archaeon]|nr:HD domain-containing protein [Nanoarchaeota archaeon]
MLKISDITIEKLENNELKDILPEFYELKDVIENNEAHVNDSVFNHSVNYIKKLQEFIPTLNKKIQKYLDQKIDNHTKKELLIIVALFHDIAKGETMAEKNGETFCPEHELQGSIKVKPILERFDLTPKQKDYILDTIKNHGHPHVAVMSDAPEENLKKFVENFSNNYIELIILAISDTMASQLDQSNPPEYQKRINLFQKYLL